MVILNKGTKLDFRVELVVEHAIHSLVFLQVLHAAFLHLSDRVNLFTDPYHYLLVLPDVWVTEVHSFLLFLVLVPSSPL